MQRTAEKAKQIFLKKTHTHSEYAESSHSHIAADISVSENTNYTANLLRGISISEQVPEAILNGSIAAVYE